MMLDRSTDNVHYLEFMKRGGRIWVNKMGEGGGGGGGGAKGKFIYHLLKNTLIC